ncbi:helix-turn-helix domain-containing protein [Lachnoanaerobaculum sp.]|uniref:helix-turn-helix domain-containing protein n=1 Tax=Lachnoanaerobaculum sp. TaxID=2049030 RepID=UPI002FE6E487
MILKFDYDGLWKLLIDKKMKKKDLTVKLGISPTTISKMVKGEPVSLTVLGKIATELESDIGEIVCLDNED